MLQAAASRVVDSTVERLNDFHDELAMLVGVKNSPPFAPSDIANLPRKYS